MWPFKKKLSWEEQWEKRIEKERRLRFEGKVFNVQDHMYVTHRLPAVELAECGLCQKRLNLCLTFYDSAGKTHLDRIGICEECMMIGINVIREAK